jgi:hypothetical protein
LYLFVPCATCPPKLDSEGWMRFVLIPYFLLFLLQYLKIFTCNVEDIHE